MELVYMVMTEIELKHSLWLLTLTVVMGIMAALSLAVAHLPMIILSILGAGLLAGIGWSVWQRQKPLPGLRIRRDGSIQLSLAGQDWRQAEVAADSFVGPGLTVIRLRTAEGQRHRLVLLPDSASPEALRRLRVSLRWAPRTHSGRACPDAG